MRGWQDRGARSTLQDVKCRRCRRLEVAGRREGWREKWEKERTGEKREVWSTGRRIRDTAYEWAQGSREASPSFVPRSYYRITLTCGTWGWRKPWQVACPQDPGPLRGQSQVLSHPESYLTGAKVILETLSTPPKYPHLAWCHIFPGEASPPIS